MTSELMGGPRHLPVSVISKGPVICGTLVKTQTVVIPTGS